jgi:hypothetical protein
VRTRLRNLGVYSLSAIDLFASAMGAFIIITLVLMPDYQKEVRLEGHLGYLESLANQAETELDRTNAFMDSLREALEAARMRQLEMQTERQITASEIEVIRARLQAHAEQPPPPDPAPEEAEEETGRNLVTFRFLGLKTDKTRILLLVDMNKYLGRHQALVARTVERALESLKPGYEFGILGFQHLDEGPQFHRWPAGDSLAPMNRANMARALRFVRNLAGQFGGSSSVAAAMEEAFASPAEAVILISDGLPNPTYNKGLPPRMLIQDIALANSRNVEIHAVTIGDYFRYRSTVEFMENLAQANAGGFLALSQ